MSNGRKIVSTSVTPLQRRAIELRLDGLSLEQVGKTLGVTTTVAIGYYIEALKRIADHIAEEKWAIRALELHRLDALQARVWPHAETGDLDAIEVILDIMEHRARLTGVFHEHVPVK